MNKNLLKQIGFNEEVKLFKKNKCVYCKDKINLNNFRDNLSKKEYNISGLCQKCQDNFFGVE